MNTLDEAGFEVIKHPVLKVRVQFYDNKWYVEYRRVPKFFFDRWWWFDDSTFAEYKDAYARAAAIASEGGTKEVKRKEIEFNVNDFN